MEEQVKKSLFSAVQPSGSVTIGNYIGAIRNFSKLQDDYNCIYAVADLHAITVPQEEKHCGTYGFVYSERHRSGKVCDVCAIAGACAL